MSAVLGCLDGLVSESWLEETLNTRAAVADCEGSEVPVSCVLMVVSFRAQVQSSVRPTLRQVFGPVPVSTRRRLGVWSRVAATRGKVSS